MPAMTAMAMSWMTLSAAGEEAVDDEGADIDDGDAGADADAPVPAPDGGGAGGGDDGGEYEDTALPPPGWVDTFT